MNFRIQTKEAVNNLFGSKLRSFLAILGILVGTASVVAMISGGELAARQVLLQFKRLGTDLMAVSITNSDYQTNDSQRNKISLDTAFALGNQSEDIVDLAPYATDYQNIEYKGRKIRGNTVGVTESFAHIAKLEQQEGRFVYYVDKFSYFCTIGSEVYKKIRKYSGDPIGKPIRVGNNIFTIVGVLKPTTENAFIDIDTNDSVFAPIQTVSLLSKYADISNIVIKTKPDADINELETKVKNYFAPYGKKLYVRNPKQFIESMQKQQAILVVFLGFIGGIALIVGGIGIMNIMLVSVTERRREIGIRLAIGAKRKDIRSLFLVEAIILTLFGGIAGIVLGVLITYIIAAIKHWDFTIFFFPIIIGFSVSFLSGIFFGFYPAYKASKLDPIETLRSE